MTFVSSRKQNNECGLQVDIYDIYLKSKPKKKHGIQIDFYWHLSQADNQTKNKVMFKSNFVNRKLSFMRE